MLRRICLFACLATVIALISAATSSSANFKNSMSPQVTWHHHCISTAHFCADFPYITGMKFSYGHSVFDGATSATRKSDDWSSGVSRNVKTGKPCEAVIASGCQQEFYAIDVFKSKYSDPWQALTAINGGVTNPTRTTFDGNLAAKFNDLYGYIGYTVWHRGEVYYIHAGYYPGPRKTKPAFATKFFSSIKLT